MMTNPHPEASAFEHEESTSPGRQGSPECVQVLLLLNTFKAGLTALQLEHYSRFNRDDIRAALTGLRYRGRVQCSHQGGRAAMWSLAKKPTPPQAEGPTP